MWWTRHYIFGYREGEGGKHNHIQRIYTVKEFWRDIYLALRRHQQCRKKTVFLFECKMYTALIIFYWTHSFIFIYLLLLLSLIFVFNLKFVSPNNWFLFSIIIKNLLMIRLQSNVCLILFLAIKWILNFRIDVYYIILLIHSNFIWK